VEGLDIRRTNLQETYIFLDIELCRHLIFMSPHAVVCKFWLEYSETVAGTSHEMIIHIENK
jgi:hypothetical protein